MNRETFRPRVYFFLALLVLCLYAAPPAGAQEDDERLQQLLINGEIKKCGQREELIRAAKEFMARNADDSRHRETLEYLKKKIPQIEEEDRICRRNDRYDNSFKAKNWDEFFAVGKEIIVEEGNSPLALDVMLDLVSVGYDRAMIDKKDAFNDETLYFARMAIQSIESRQTSRTGKYGVFLPFNKKEVALSWMNFIAGWLLYNKMNRQKDALEYYYKAIRTGEKKNDINIYTSIGGYYFDEAVRLDTEYREKRKANGNEDSDETNALLGLARGTADCALDAFGRAYLAAFETKLNKQLTNNIYKNLTDLYKYRFNQSSDEGMKDFFEEFIEQLRTRPLPDSAQPCAPFELPENMDEKLRRLKDY